MALKESSLNQSYESALVPYDRAWARSSTDGILAGVCAGIARRFGINLWWVRIGWIISVFAFGTGIAAYLVLAYALPREDEIGQAQSGRFLGVCSRIARRTGWDVGLVRALSLAFAIPSFGLTLVAYFILNFVLEDDSAGLIC